jgi:hypothetical protein
MIEEAILKTVAYADVFDFPLNRAEIHRYLLGERLTEDKTLAVLLDIGGLIPGLLSQVDGHFTLPGREDIVAVRQKREQIADKLWNRAISYGRIIGQLPFVRMVALTGALAMRNIESNADMDYLIVTRPNRLWVSRAMAILLVRFGAKRGDTICPNYFLSERALQLTDENVFTAHELAQMIPISGPEIYTKMRSLNRWSETYLPNAIGAPLDLTGKNDTTHPLKPISEFVLKSRLGSLIEDWEMERKIKKFSQRIPEHHEASFSTDWCKGHFDDHGQQALTKFNSRLADLQEKL